jgi:hypothetical protein
MYKEKESTTMCVGIALAASEMPQELLEQPLMKARFFTRGGEPEVRFFFRDAERLLPIIHEGKLRLVRWGARRSESAVLPPTGWTWLASVEGGQWGQTNAEPVVIAADMGLEKGIWFRTRQGIHGLLVRDEYGIESTYMLCEPASHYFQVMTRSNRMPVLIGERI